MKQFKAIAAALILSASLSACATDGLGVNINKQMIGTGLGGAAGGFGGSMIGRKGSMMNTIATIGGTLIGGYVGSEIGASLDKADKLAAGQALNAAQPGQQVSWTNQETGKKVIFTPGPQTTQTPQGAAPGSQCRTWQSQVIAKDGSMQQGSGTSCKQADGSWSL